MGALIGARGRVRITQIPSRHCQVPHRTTTHSPGPDTLPASPLYTVAMSVTQKQNGRRWCHMTQLAGHVTMMAGSCQVAVESWLPSVAARDSSGKAGTGSSSSSRSEGWQS